MTPEEYEKTFGRPMPGNLSPGGPRRGPTPPPGKTGDARLGPRAATSSPRRPTGTKRAGGGPTSGRNGVPVGAHDITDPDQATIAATDGSSDPNPGPGGWAWTVHGGGWRAGAATRATNNAMELRAISELLAAAPRHIEMVVLVDSQYALNAVCNWAAGWQANNWRTSKGDPVSNIDVIQAILDLAEGRPLRFNWVRGHTGHPLNEHADELAGRAMRTQRNDGPGWSGKP